MKPVAASLPAFPACEGERGSCSPSGWHPDLLVPWSFGCGGLTNPAIQRLQAERALSQHSGGLSLLFLAVYFGTFEQGGSSRPFTEREKRGKANTCLYLQGSHSKLPDASRISCSPAGAWKQLTKWPLSYSAPLEARDADWLKLWVFRLNLGVWHEMFCCATLAACLESFGGKKTSVSLWIIRSGPN